MNFGLNFGLLSGIKTPPPFRISSIEQLEPGNCDLTVLNPCTATSIHKVHVANPTYGLVNDSVTSYSHATSGTGNTISNIDNVFTIHNEVPTTSEFNPFCRLHGIYQSDIYFEITVKVEVTRGTMFFKTIGYSRGGIDSEQVYDEALGVGTHIKTVRANYRTNNLLNIVFDGTQEWDFDATVTIETKQIFLSYVWSVDAPAFILDGQGTDIVTVSTTTDTDDTFDLTCEVTDINEGTVTDTVSVTHTRDPYVPPPYTEYLDLTSTWDNPGGSTGTYILTVTADGFELETFGDGTDGDDPDIITNYVNGDILPSGTDTEYGYTITVLSGENNIFFSNPVGQLHLGADIAEGDHTFTKTTTSGRLSAYFSFNETKTGKIRVSNYTVKAFL